VVVVGAAVVDDGTSDEVVDVESEALAEQAPAAMTSPERTTRSPRIRQSYAQLARHLRRVIEEALIPLGQRPAMTPESQARGGVVPARRCRGRSGYRPDVAEYGTTLYCRRWADDLIRCLLEAGRRWAKELNLEMHFRSRARPGGNREWEIWVDGNSFGIAAWSRRLERDLPTVAQGFIGIERGQAEGIAESLATRWIGWCVGNDDAWDTRIRTSVRDPGRWIWPVLDYPLDTPHTDRLVLADDVLARWLVGGISDEIVVEELHTIVEAMLRHRLGAGQSVLWPRLLERACTARLLDDEELETLRAFNSGLRRKVKHAAATLSDFEREEAESTLWKVITIAERRLGRAG